MSVLDWEGLLSRITYRIRQSLELQEILATTVGEVRAFLGTDRVKIYKFHLDGSGQVVAEAIHENRLPSLLGLNFPADDIPPQARQLFVQARVRSVVDVETRQIGQSQLRDTLTGTALTEEFQYRPLDPCHAEYLTAMGVKSSLVLPILHWGKLWGLLVSHHTAPTSIQDSALQGVQLVVDQLSVAIAQAELLTQAQEKADREATLNRITNLLHSLTTIELQQALEETVAAFQGSGGRLWVNGAVFCPLSRAEKSDKGERSPQFRLYTCGTQPQLEPLHSSLEQSSLKHLFLEQHQAWQNTFQTSPEACAIADLYQVAPLQELYPGFYATTIRGLLVVRLQVRQQIAGYLSIFRDEVEMSTLWAGEFDPDERQIYPRSSFIAWQQSKVGQVKAWSSHEVQLAQALANQFVTAIEQYELHQQVQALNTSLEDQVRERTAQLEQATEQQRILFEVVSKMRKSLDINTIFLTVTQEVRQVLKADRVGVYRFDPDSQFNDGEFVAEDVLPEFSAAMAVRIHDHCFGEVYAEKYSQGRIHSLDDIYQVNLPECYVSLLEQFQIKAIIVVPLLKGERLWGLLCVHQCCSPRTWSISDIQFVAQIADQLRVALEQVELLTQTRQQAEQLADTLQHLHKTQSQLVQTEKMSSLGQLVAGVAHEINNPVNFIYGNLTHVNSYTEDLLNLLHLYQLHYPDPHPTIANQTEAIDLEFVADDLPKTLSSMKIGADRIRQIVLSLRNFSRLDQSEMKSVNIHEGIDSTLLILQHRLKGKGDTPRIELVKEYSNLPLIECYAGQLNQVFMNLLSNAIDALEEWNSKRSFQSAQTDPATITVRTKLLSPQRVAIHIADNGMGISEEARLHLFDPFFTTKPIGKGTGLGLSISYQIVTEKHGGELKCLPTEQGAEFVIEIPIKQF